MSGFGTTARSATAADLEESTEYAQKFKGRKGLLSLEKETVISGPPKPPLDSNRLGHIRLNRRRIGD